MGEQVRPMRRLSTMPKEDEPLSHAAPGRRDLCLHPETFGLDIRHGVRERVREGGRRVKIFGFAPAADFGYDCALTRSASYPQATA